VLMARSWLAQGVLANAAVVLPAGNAILTRRRRSFTFRNGPGAC